MQRRHPRHPPILLIDGMGTLVTLADPAAALRRGLSRRLGLDVDLATVRGALRAEIAYYREHMQDGVDAPSLADLRRRCAAQLAAHLPVPAAAGGHDPDLMTELLLAALRFEPFHDAAPLLRRVRADGARIVVVSNWDVSLIEVLEQTGLAPLLDGVVTSAAVGVRKPAPAIFRAALALAGARPGDAIHVGDSAAEDVAGARECGIAAVLLDRAGMASSPHGAEVIATLGQLTWPPPGPDPNT